MLRAKIYGAGSIGNHLAHASRRLGWSVTVCDVDELALRRMRDEIYPARYGSWDPEISLVPADRCPRGEFDVILVGTPPESHVALALDALEEAPRAVLVEKPACTPSLEGADAIVERASATATRVFVGYNHVVSEATRTVEALLASGAIGEVQTIDVDWREHWGGIFAAHPWLSGPADSYLGFWRRGGGAAGEHSHGINLWQHFAHAAGAGRVTEVAATVAYVDTDGVDYDEICALGLRTERGLVGRVTQDVVGVPARKVARIQGDRGALSWIGNHDESGDAVLCERPGRADELVRIEKARPDDFIQELEHLQAQLDAPDRDPAISLRRGLDTMLVVAAAHRSQHEGRHVRIAYDEGYRSRALAPSA
jgi:predicted dehydrogenase